MSVVPDLHSKPSDLPVSHKHARLFAAAVVLPIAIVSTALVVTRGGAIAWFALVCSLLLLLKIRLRPARSDLFAACGIAIVGVLSWLVVHHHVISTWESGEVVELTIDTSEGQLTARLWVFDIDGDPHVYYDAPPQAAASLLAGDMVVYNRGGVVSNRVPAAFTADDLSQESVTRVVKAMQDKYGDRNNAAVLYYLLLGSPRDRVALVVRLAETS